MKKQTKTFLTVLGVLFFIALLLFGIPVTLNMEDVDDFSSYYNIKSYATNNVLNREGGFYTRISPRKFHHYFLEVDSCVIEANYTGLKRNEEESLEYGNETIEMLENTIWTEGYLIENFYAIDFKLQMVEYKFDCEITTSLISYIVSSFQDD